MKRSMFGKTKVLLMAAVVSCALAGCGGKGGGNNPPMPLPAQAAAQKSNPEPAQPAVAPAAPAPLAPVTPIVSTRAEPATTTSTEAEPVTTASTDIADLGDGPIPVELRERPIVLDINVHVNATVSCSEGHVTTSSAELTRVTTTEEAGS